MLEGSVADPVFNETVARLFGEGKTVFALNVDPDQLANAVPGFPVHGEDPGCVLSYITRDSSGAMGLGSLAAMDTSSGLNASLDVIIDSLNRALSTKTAASTGPDVSRPFRTFAAGSYYSSGDWREWWGSDSHGWQHVKVTGWNLRNDGMPTQDYWVAQLLQETDPGCHRYGNGNNWRTSEVRTKCWKAGSVLTIDDAAPPDTDPMPTVSYSIGMSPSMNFSYSIPPITVDKKTQPPDNARWSHTYNWYGSQAIGYSSTKPAFAEIVPQDAQFASSNYVTNVWENFLSGVPIGSYTLNWQVWNATINKPPY